MRLSALRKRKPTDRELLESASGKLTLMSKLLPKLQREGHKVLIFSQFKIMLNVIEDYLNLLNMPLERIDGDTNGAPGSPPSARGRRCLGREHCGARPLPAYAAPLRQLTANSDANNASTGSPFFLFRKRSSTGSFGRAYPPFA